MPINNQPIPPVTAEAFADFRLCWLLLKAEDLLLPWEPSFLRGVQKQVVEYIPLLDNQIRILGNIQDRVMKSLAEEGHLA